MSDSSLWLRPQLDMSYREEELEGERVTTATREVYGQGPGSVERDLRAEAMNAFYGFGATLEEVGRAFGLTRERVRQILRENGFRTRSAAETAALRQKTHVVREQLAPGKSAAIIESVKNGLTVDEICSSEGLEREAVWREVREAEAREELKTSDVRDLVGSHIGQKYTTEELLEMLRIANAAADGILSVEQFSRFGKLRKLEDGRPWPTHQTFLLRFGSWRRALLAAGLPANASSAVTGRISYTRADCLEALRTVAGRLGRVPSANQYEVVARESRGELPSLATVRNRLGGWANGLREAGF